MQREDRWRAGRWAPPSQARAISGSTAGSPKQSARRRGRPRAGRRPIGQRAGTILTAMLRSASRGGTASGSAWGSNCLRLKSKVIASFRNFDHDGIRRAFAGVILRKLETKTSGLHADRGIRLGIKIAGAPVHFGGNLILLQRSVGMIEGLFCQVLQQLAKGLGAPQAMTFNNVIYLLEELFRAGGESACHSHLTPT